MLPGDRPEPRISFTVARGDEHAYTLSQTRAELPFRAIPQGTHHLEAHAGGQVATGFAGPGGSGVDLAYLRWRRLGVTYELAATLRPWLDEEDVQALAVALMERLGDSD